MSALRVSILASDEVLRWGLGAMVRALPAVELARSCGSAGELRGRLHSEHVDVLIVSEGDAGEINGLQDQLAAAGTRILLLMDGRPTGDLRGYGRFAVDGFASQGDLCPEILGEALGRCAAGLMPMPAGLAKALLGHADRPMSAPAPASAGRLRQPALTSRESETLHLIAEGLSNVQIARRLGISSHGAKRLVASVMIKLSSPNRTTAVVHAIRAGLIDCRHDERATPADVRGGLTVITTPHRRVSA